MLKSSFQAAGCTCLALSTVAIGWRGARLPSWMTVSSLLVASAMMSLHALGAKKIGIQRTLGTSLSLNNSSRKLGLLERWYIAHSRAGHHTGFSLALECCCTNNEAPITLEQVRRILRNVSFQFPWLRVKVHRQGVQGVDSRERLHGKQQHELWGDDLYVRVEEEKEVDYCHVRQVTIKDDNSFGMANGLCQVLQQEGQTEWHDEDPTECLWRAVLVVNHHVDNPQTFGLVLSFHHLQADGMGALAIVQEIVHESSRMNFDAKKDIHEHNVLAPPMEDVLDTVPRLSHLLMPVLLDRFPSLARMLKPPHFQGMPHDDRVSPTDRTSNMVCLSLLDEKQVSALRESCRRQYGTSVNSTCVAALCRAIVKHVADERFADFYNTSPGLLENGDVRLEIITAVNERPACGMTNQDLGVYLVGPQVSVQASSKTSLKEIASLYQTRLRSARQSARMDIGLCKFIQEDWIEFAKKNTNRPPNGREDSIEVSNLGHAPLNSDGNGWDVEGLWFAQGRNVTGPALTFTLVSSVGGLKGVLSAVPHTFTRDSLVAIGKELEADLVMLVGKDAE